MNLKHLSYFALAFSLTGCGQATTEPVPAPQKEISEAKAPEIPPQFQGKWSQDCENEEAISTLLIEPNQINFYESSGPIRAVVQRGEFEVALISELSGEGEAWLSLAKFRLGGGNTNLIDVTDENAPYTRQKCEATVEAEKNSVTAKEVQAPLGSAATPSVSNGSLTCEQGINGAPALGSKHQDGVYLCREPVEMYWNDWYAIQPASPDGTLEIKSDGKTSAFSGTLAIDCASDRTSWINARNFDEPIGTDQEISDVVPAQVIVNAKRQACKAAA